MMIIRRIGFVLALTMFVRTTVQCGPVDQAVAVPAAEEAIRSRIEERLKHHDEVLQAARSRADEMADLPEYEAVTNFEEELNRIRRWLDKGDLVRAYDRSWDYGFRDQSRAIENNIIMAIPCLIIGPFGEERFTDLSEPAAWIAAGGEAMDHPFMGEFEEPPEPPAHQNYLPSGFVVDREAVYSGFGGREVKWIEAWKTDALGFSDIAAPDGLWSVAYIYLRVYSPETRPLVIGIGGDVPAMMGWVNRRQWILRPNREAERETLSFNQGGAALREGWNTILFKVLQRAGTKLTLRLLHRRERDEAGRRLPQRIMDDLEFELPGTE